MLETTEVVGFGYESDGRDGEAKEFGTKSEAGTVAEPEEEGYQTTRTRLEKVQAKFEKRVLSDFRYQMQTGNQERVAFVDVEFMKMSGFCRDCIGWEKKTIRDGVSNEHTGKIDDQVVISWSTLEYMRDNW